MSELSAPDIDLGVTLREERRNPLRLIVELCQLDSALTPRTRDRILHIAQAALDAIPLEGECEQR